LEENANSWMDSMIAARAQMLTQEEATAGNTLVSIETTGEGDYDFSEWIAEHPAQFFRRLRLLSGYDQDLLLSYFVAKKSQQTMVAAFQRSQTYVSLFFREAMLHFVTGTSDDYSRQIRVNGEPRKGHKRIGDPRVLHADPAELGQFRVDVTSPGFASLFQPTQYGGFQGGRLDMED
jgi:hypothetical protein